MPIGLILKGLRDLTNLGSSELRRFSDKGFLEATVAALIMTAMANDRFDDSERAKIKQIVTKHPVFNVFKHSECQAASNKTLETFQLDSGVGQEEAWQKIDQIADNQEHARACVIFCCAVGKADGYFDPTQKKVVRDIAQRLGVNTSDIEDLAPSS